MQVNYIIISSFLLAPYPCLTHLLVLDNTEFSHSDLVCVKSVAYKLNYIHFHVGSDRVVDPCCADDVGNTAAFLASPLASSVTGSLIYVDNGLHAMGLAVDSPSVAKAAAPASELTNVAA